MTMITNYADTVLLVSANKCDITVPKVPLL